MATAPPLDRPVQSSTPVSDPTFEPDQAPEAEVELFTPAERRQFEADDEEAARNIGKILTTLFVYTLIAMSVVTWWTFGVVD